MSVLYNGSFEQVDIRGEGDDMVDIDKFYAFVVGSVSVYAVVFEGCVVVGVDAECAQQPFEGGFVGMHVEEQANAVALRVAGYGQIVVSVGKFTAHGFESRQGIHDEKFVHVRGKWLTIRERPYSDILHEPDPSLKL